jgi:diguanylate cyclase (GGDEF)-like protein
VQAVPGDALPSGLIEVDASNRIVDVNELVLTWTGVDAESLVGKLFEEVAQPPKRVGGVVVEYLPSVAEIFHRNGALQPVLVAAGIPGPNGNRFVTLFNATEQRAFRERLQAEHALTQRAQTRLELVIGASIAFAEATTELALAEVLAATTASAYVAEESVVFLLDDQMVFRQVAGSNPFVGVGDAASLALRAAGLHSVLKISGVDAARALSPAVGKAFDATGVQSMIIAPIRLRDEPLGILAAFFYHPRTFDEQASPLADALAGQAARAVSALRLQQRLAHAAMHDAITGLPNRRLLEQQIEGVRTTGDSALGLLFVDLDGFKNVNDQLGHHVGDELLREVAARLQSTVREQDVVARYGGDEFVILCEVTDERAAVELAERVMHSVRAPYETLPAGFAITASIGLSVTPSDSAATDAELLIRWADQAMYRAKSAGGDRVASTTA